MIVWGTDSRKEDGGVVGDWCEVCRAPCYFRLVHIFKVTQVYFIPIGRGEYVGTNRQCTQCGSVYGCQVGAYGSTLTHQEATGRTIQQVLEATNPTLLAQLEEQSRLDAIVTRRMAEPVVPPLGATAAGPDAAREVDRRMLAALQTLRGMDAGDRRIVAFVGRLHTWDYLSPAEREVLLHEIDTFGANDQKFTAAIHFMRALWQPIPEWLTSCGCLFALIGGIVCLALTPFLHSWLWGPIFVVLIVPLWYYADKLASDQAVRLWVRKALIPRARERSIDLNQFIELLAEIKAARGGYEAKINIMSFNVDLIAAELRKHGEIPRG